MRKPKPLPTKDFREENPKLHRLYVTYAQEDLKILNECIEQLGAVSRVNMSIAYGLLAEEKRKLIASDAAYQEACWRLEADELLSVE